MRLLIISDSIYPYNKGGKEKRIYELLSRIQKKDISVLVFTMKWWDGPHNEIVREGVRYIAISKNVPLYSSENIRSIWQALYFALKLFYPLFHYRKEYDIIDADQIPYFQLFIIKCSQLITRKPFFCTWHEVFGRRYWMKYLGGFKGSIASYVEYFSSKMPDAFIAVSESVQNDLVSMLHVQKKKIFLVENGVDIEAIKKIHPSKKECDIIFAGRLLAHKNVDLLLRSIAQLQQKEKTISAAIIGDGPERNALENLAGELSLESVDFLGFVESHDDVFSYMKSARVFAFPSEREGFGVVVLEAYACGLPVVTLDVEKNHAKDLVTNKTGKATQKDVGEYAQALSEVLSAGKGSYTEEIKKVVQKYSWDSAALRVAELYKKIS